MKFSIDTIKDLGKTGVQLVKKHGPEILTGIGVVCFIATPVLAVKATPKALDELDNERRRRKMDALESRKVNRETDSDAVDAIVEETSKLKPLDYIKCTWKLYMPAVTTGVMGIACIVGSTSVSMRRNASLVAACALTETRFSDYKEQVKKVLGDKKEKDVRSAVAEEELKAHPVSQSNVIDTGKGETLFYDPICSNYYRSDISYVERCINMLNHQLLYDENVVMNDFYDLLGIEPSKAGEDLGWNRDRNGLIELSLDSKLADDGTPCVVVDFMEGPFYTGYSYIGRMSDSF